MNHSSSGTRTQLQSTDSTSSGVVKSILIAAVWFGLVTGLVEGMGLWVLQQLSWLAGQLIFLGSGPEVLWIAPLFDVLLFVGVGLALSLAAWLFPRLPIMLLSVFVFVFLTFFNWLTLLLSGRINTYVIALLAIGLAAESARWFHKRQERAVRLWRRSAPWLAGLALLALVAIQGGSWVKEETAIARLPEADPGSPNILVIVVDTLRADHLASYGYDRPTSPNLDRIAMDGVLFENAFSTSSWTKPSHASLVTGRYTHEHGADTSNSLDKRYPTIGEALQRRGYRTGAFSANFRVFSRREGFGRGFHHFEDYYRSIGDITTGTLYGRVFEVYVLHRMLGVEDEVSRKWAASINHAVLSWIDREHEKPFFAFLNYYDPHAPFVPPQPYRGKFSQLEEPGGVINSYWDYDHIYVPMTPEQFQGEIDAYDGAIAYVDDNIGRLLDELQERGLAENTLVVITSDHGELLGEHGLLLHGNSLYREVIHVPLIFWWPGHIPEGVRVAQTVSNATLPATLLNLIGEDEQTLFPGNSIMKLWKDPSVHRDWPDPLAELALTPWSPIQNPSAHGAMKSVVTPQWQYIVHEKFGEELYDWRSDPQETNNVAGNADMEAIVSQFRTYIETLLAGNSDPLQLSGLLD